LNQTSHQQELLFIYFKNTRPKKENLTDSLKKMPSSCADLNDIGHTLNAFYLVKDEEVNSFKLQTVYCDFQSLISSSSKPASDYSKKKTFKNTFIHLVKPLNYIAMEKRLGFIDIKPSPNGVYFYVQRNESAENNKGSGVVHYNVQRFTIQRLNLGGAMNGCE